VEEAEVEAEEAERRRWESQWIWDTQQRAARSG